ncbi:MAG TPA: hypothetical protein PLI70_03235 [Gemmatimonadales bacterium]|nr:hypothetical protein [Gemmatimonadales bacterium]HRZ10503.1 hypothetical protein [Gemmatimonadales bacterium]
MQMTLRSTLALTIAALSAAGCSDSTEPTDTVPRQLYYIAHSPGAYPYTRSIPRLFGVALDGSAPVSVIPDSVLAIHPIDVGFPPWISPDGKRIKVLSGDSIMTVDPFGAPLSIAPYPDSVPGYPGPALSPDGTTFAWFTRGFLNLAKVEGGAEWTKIYFDSLGPVLALPAWSRDGRTLAYVSHFTSQITGQPQDIRVWTRRLSDGFARPVATLDVVPVSLAWSQDGRWLTVGLDGEVHRLRTDGSGPVQVVFSGGEDWPSSSWGPRDSLLAIVTGNDLLVMHPDGTGARTVATGLWLWFASWRN